MALILFLSDYETVDEGPRSSLSSEGAPRSDGKVSSRAGIGKERKLGQVLPLPRSDHRMPVDEGTPIKAVPRLQRAKGKASQLVQCSRICLPVQETQETRVCSLGREDPLEEGNGSLLQYSCLENPMARGAWRATVHGVTESDTTERLSTHAWLILFGVQQKLTQH